MKYMEKIEKRRSIREFKKKELKQEKLDRIQAGFSDIGATMMNFDAIASQQDWVDWKMGAPDGIETVIYLRLYLERFLL